MARTKNEDADFNDKDLDDEDLNAEDLKDIVLEVSSSVSRTSSGSRSSSARFPTSRTRFFTHTDD